MQLDSRLKTLAIPYIPSSIFSFCIHNTILQSIRFFDKVIIDNKNKVYRQIRRIDSFVESGAMETQRFETVVTRCVTGCIRIEQSGRVASMPGRMPGQYEEEPIN